MGTVCRDSHPTDCPRPCVPRCKYSHSRTPVLLSTRSEDGVTWELVTPGCRAPQLELVARGYQTPDMPQPGAGTKEFRCDPADPKSCYGEEYCHPQLRTCKSLGSVCK
jgi:hypothetical protein